MNFLSNAFNAIKNFNFGKTFSNTVRRVFNGPTTAYSHGNPMNHMYSHGNGQNSVNPHKSFFTKAFEFFKKPANKFADDVDSHGFGHASHNLSNFVKDSVNTAANHLKQVGERKLAEGIQKTENFVGRGLQKAEKYLGRNAVDTAQRHVGRFVENNLRKRDMSAAGLDRQAADAGNTSNDIYNPMNNLKFVKMH